MDNNTKTIIEAVTRANRRARAGGPVAQYNSNSQSAGPHSALLGPLLGSLTGGAAAQNDSDPQPVADHPESHSDKEGGLYILTFTGRMFYPQALTPDMVSIIDIAQALSHINRFGGHTPFPYSVAQHCVLASIWVPPAHGLQALLHDAPEAYTGDMLRPFKAFLPDFCAFEDKVWRVIAAKYGVPVELHPEVKLIDDRLLVTEAPVLQRQAILASKDARDRLAAPEWWKESRWPDPLDLRIEPWPVERARKAFLTRFKQLGGRD